MPLVENMAEIFYVKIHRSGDTDGRVPVTSSRYSLHNLSLSIEDAWRPWYSNKEVNIHIYMVLLLTYSNILNNTLYLYLFHLFFSPSFYFFFKCVINTFVMDILIYIFECVNNIILYIYGIHI